MSKSGREKREGLREWWRKRDRGRETDDEHKRVREINLARKQGREGLHDFV